MAYEMRDIRPMSGNATLVGIVSIQAVLGLEFLLGGLNKLATPAYADRFREFVAMSPGAQHGILSGIVQALVLPQFAVTGQLARFTELGAGLVLLITAAEVVRLHLGGRWVRNEALFSLAAAAAGVTLAGLSTTIYLLLGGGLPRVNPALAFGPPIAIELFNVPVALVIAWVQLGRFVSVRSAQMAAMRIPADHPLPAKAA
jgi:hypothetical protein